MWVLLCVGIVCGWSAENVCGCYSICFYCLCKSIIRRSMLCHRLIASCIDTFNINIARPHLSITFFLSCWAQPPSDTIQCHGEHLNGHQCHVQAKIVINIEYNRHTTHSCQNRPPNIYFNLDNFPYSPYIWIAFWHRLGSARLFAVYCNQSLTLVPSYAFDDHNTYISILLLFFRFSFVSCSA